MNRFNMYSVQRMRCHLVAAILMTGWGATVAIAGVNVASVSVTNYSGFVIAADGQTPGSRGALAVQTFIEFTTASSDPVTNNYLIAFSLLSEDDKLVMLSTGAATTNRILQGQSVVVSSKDPQTLSFSASLYPATRLSARS